jgi:hypothetical protein
METLRRLSKTRPIVFGWICYFGAWTMMAVVVLPVSMLINRVVGTTAAGLTYYGAAIGLGCWLLLIRRQILDQLGNVVIIESVFAPLLRLVLWAFAWAFAMPVGLLLTGLRAARI